MTSCGSSTRDTFEPWTAPAVVSSEAMPSSRANARRDASTGAGSGAWINPTEPSPVVENPCSSPDSAASCGIVSTSGAVTRLSLRAGLGAARAQDLLDLTLDLLEVHELPVDRREPD